MNQKKEQELLDLVKKNYSDIAGDFDRTRKKYLWPELSKLASEIKNGSKVLDAGCGNGRLLEALQGKNISYFGFDGSKELISLAKQNYPGEKFLVADILDNLFLQNNFYDKIFCIAVIPHIPGRNKRVEVLQSLHKKLAPGGEMIMSFWDLRSQAKYRKQLFWATLRKFFSLNNLDYGDLLFDWQGSEKSKRYYHAFSKKELEIEVKAAGLKIHKLYRADNNFWLIIKANS